MLVSESPFPMLFPIFFFFFFEKPTASFGLYILLSLFFSCSITLGISITRNYLYSLDYFGLKIVHTITTLHTWLSAIYCCNQRLNTLGICLQTAVVVSLVATFEITCILVGCLILLAKAVHIQLSFIFW